MKQKREKLVKQPKEKPNKKSTKQPKEKSGGLFGLFRKKDKSQNINDQPQQPPQPPLQPQYNTQGHIPPPGHVPPPPPVNQPMYQPQQIQTDEGWICNCGKSNISRFCSNCGSQKPEPKPIQPQVQPAQTYEQAPVRPQEPFYTEQQSNEIYKHQEIKQDIFLYTEATIFDAVLDHYSKKVGFNMAGTNIATNLIPTWNEMPLRNILIVHSNPAMNKPVADFIRFLVDNKRLNPDGIAIYFIATTEVKSREYLAQYLKDIDRFMTIYQANISASSITLKSLDILVSKIVENQPAYLERQKSAPLPKMATKTETTDIGNLFRIKNLDELKSSVLKAKNMPPEDRQAMQTKLEEAILKSTSPKEMRETIAQLPEMKVLKDYEKLLEEYVKEVQETPGTTFDINKLMNAKLELTSVEENVLRNIFNTTLKVALQTSEEERVKAMRQSDELAQSLEIAGKQVEDLLVQRNQLKEKVLSSYTNFKKQTVLISNTIALRKQMYIDMQKSVKALTANIDIDRRGSEELINIASEMMGFYVAEQDKYEAVNTEVMNKLSESINFANQLFKSYNILINMDDIIIDELLYQNRTMQENNITRVNVVEKAIQTKGVLHMYLDKDLLDLMTSLYKPSTLVISFISQDLLELEKDTYTITYDEFKTFDWASSLKLPNYLIIDDSDSLHHIVDALSKSVEYLATKYNKIIYLANNNTDIEVLKLAKETVLEAVNFTGDDSESLLFTNKVCNLLSDQSEMHMTNIVNLAENNTDIANIQKLLGTTARPMGEKYISLERAVQSEELFRSVVAMLSNLG